MKHRIFIAFKVSEKAKTELKNVQEQFKKYNKRAHVTWSKPRGFHVTLQFIGEIEAYQVEKVGEMLNKIANEYHSFKYWLDHLDAFPNKSRPKVITARVREEKKTSFSMQRKIVAGLIQLNLIKEDKPWKPHITLGRNKTEQAVKGFASIKMEPVIWEVDSVELIESDLQADGPRYKVRGSYSLARNT